MTTLAALRLFAPDREAEARAIDRLLPLALAEMPAAKPRAVARVAESRETFPLRFPYAR